MAKKRKTTTMRKIAKRGLLFALVASLLLVVNCSANDFAKQKEAEKLQKMSLMTLNVERIPNLEDVTFLQNLKSLQPTVSISKNEVKRHSSPQEVKAKEEAKEVPKKEIWRYYPTEEELDFAYKIAFAEAGNQDSIGQTAVIEVILNSIEAGYARDVKHEICRPGRFSSVINGLPSIPDRGGWRPVRGSDLSNSLKQAVQEAFKGKRVTEELLKKQAESQGLYDEAYWKGGALYFFNWAALSEGARADRTYGSMPVRVKIGNHTFARYWR